MNLDDIRITVRDHVDQDESDLPNSRIDHWIREGYERVIQLETRWPFFEKQWTMVISPSTPSFELPVDAALLVAIRSDQYGRLEFVDQRDGEDYFFTPGATASPSVTCYWSKVGRTVNLWPAPNVQTTFTLRGFRYPTDWISLGATSVVDADERLHWPIVNYTLARAYIQQEDEILYGQHMADFREGVGLARQAVMRPWRNESLILGGRYPKRDPFRSHNLKFVGP